MAKSRKRRKAINSLIILAVLAIAGFALWRFIAAIQTVETLDRLDGWLSSAEVELAGDPVLYGEHSGQKLFIHRPTDIAATEKLPVIGFVHGGSWKDGDPKDYNFIARTFAPEGFVVVNIGYRLVPDGPFPGMVEDTAAAVRWIKDNINEHGGDPESIYLMGHSAGAYNAIKVALDRQWLGREGLDENALKGVVGLAGPYDFYPFDSDSTRDAFGGWARPEATQPINFARGDAPPMLLATGAADETVQPRNSHVLAEAIGAAGGDVETAFFDDMSHARIIMALAKPFDSDTRPKDAIMAFLRAQETAETVQAN